MSTVNQRKASTFNRLYDKLEELTKEKQFLLDTISAIHDHLKKGKNLGTESTAEFDSTNIELEIQDELRKALKLCKKALQN